MRQMLSLIKNIFKKPEMPKKKPRVRHGVFSADFFNEQMDDLNEYRDEILVENALRRTFQKSVNDFPIVGTKTGVAMDSKEDSVIAPFSRNSWGINPLQLSWYASQGFIGHETCAIIAQNWLVEKACNMPGEDALRNGYEVTVTDGTEVDAEIFDAIRDSDEKYHVTENLTEFVKFGRVFGIRVMLFEVESNDPEYYVLPFNPDGVTPGSYKGMCQIDPQWVLPELDQDAATNPMSRHFYEPTYWQIRGQRIHRSHLVIMKNSTVADILKPTYLYGGVSIPQKIYQRVYASERTADEAPLLAMSKRTTVYKTDLDQAIAKQQSFARKIANWAWFRDNHGIKVAGKNDEITQFDTSLNDLDVVIMTQYQIVAAIAEVPAVKLMGTSPKGFNASGRYEEESYHEKLESIQKHNMSPVIRRHHLMLIRSEIAPRFGIKPFETGAKWNPSNSTPAEELAKLNRFKSETDANYVTMGAIDGGDVRARLIADPHSGYNGLDAGDLPEEADLDDEELDDEDIL